MFLGFARDFGAYNAKQWSCRFDLHDERGLFWEVAAGNYSFNCFRL